MKKLSNSSSKYQSLLNFKSWAQVNHSVRKLSSWTVYVQLMYVARKIAI